MSEKEEKSLSKERLFAFDEDLSSLTVPDELPVLPLRGVVVFPSAVVPLLVSRGPSRRAVEEALEGDRMLALIAQKNPDEEEPPTENLYARGTVGRVLKMLKYPDTSVRVLVQGLHRIDVVDYAQTEPYLRARVRQLQSENDGSPAIDAMQAHLVNRFAKFVSLIPYLPDDVQVVAMNIKEPGKVADLIASNLNVSLEERQELLSILDIRKRLERVSTILNREIELLELGSKIQSDVHDELSKSQRDYFLRQQMRAIQKELGEGDPRETEIEDLRRRLVEANLPEAAAKVATTELERLRVIPVESAEHSVVRTYLECIVNLPWTISTEDNLDILHARQILDEDHYDLEKIKDRVLEFLAVRKLKKDSKGPILCFVGPPGTGKTSLGRSIARAMERKFIRLSLGGIRDEAEIRGHRRTYIGSLPGRIIQGLRTCGSNNPLFMLDEIDKLGMDFRGDPASALLEVLDPEQNNSFQDHYLDVPFDLSKVMFVTTANILDPIPSALRDRMEVIELTGYTEQDKLHIARQYLIPKQCLENGITADQVVFPDEGLLHLVHHYTHEAGLRNLEREIGSICRKVARRVTEGRTEIVSATPETIGEMLGPERFESEIAERTDEPGVSIGLVWTPMGGDIVFIEATKMAGQKGLTLTGHLGDVMKESAQAALSHIRSRAERFGIPADFFEKLDIHIHVPAGAVPKDGPSAGVTIATALASLLTGRPVRHDLAMTGEITLRGKVLPVGGIKEKVLGAKRAGINCIILPKRNEKDLQEIDEAIRNEMQFLFVETVEQALDLALQPAAPTKPLRAASKS